MMPQRWREISLLLLTLVVAVLLILNSQRYFTRIDFTGNKLYSISDVSKQEMNGLSEQVSITYYVSDKLRNVSQTPQLIEDLLDEYATYGGGNIKIEVVDPDKTGLSEEVQKLGIEPRQIQVVEENEQTYAKVFSGISIRYLDRQEVLPLVFSTETLEYHLTSNIRKLVRQDERRIGILVGDPSMTLQNDFSALYETLSGSFEVEELTRGEMIPERIEILFLLGGGEELDVYDLLHIDQFLMGGGNAFFGVGGVALDLDANLKASHYTNSSLLEVLEFYGVKVEEKLALDTYAKNFRVPRQTFGGISWEVLDKYPHWISVRPSNVDQEHPITARLQGLDLLWTSPLSIMDPAEGYARSIVKSSKEAWVMEDPFVTDPSRVGNLSRKTAESAGQYTLGVALEKEFESYYASHGITPPPGEIIPYDEIRQKGKSSRVVLFGGTLFASNLIQYSDSMYNMNFLLNSADWLAEDDDLMQIRTRTVGDTRLNRLDPERAQFQYAFSQIVNLIVVPLIVIGFGLLRYALRRRQHGILQEEEYDLQD